MSIKDADVFAYVVPLLSGLTLSRCSGVILVLELEH